jgi:hypothetical protein
VSSRTHDDGSTGGAAGLDSRDEGELLGPEHEERPPPAGTVQNLIIGGAVVLLGAAAVTAALDLGIGRPAAPGPGTWPFLVACVLLVLGLVLTVTARRTHDAERFTTSATAALAGLATMAVFVAMIDVIGFEIPSALLAFVWLKLIGHESWRLSVTTSLVVVATLYLLFVGMLAVPVPHLF